MRRTLLALSVLSALALAGIRCASADPEAVSACPPHPVADRRSPPSPRLEVVDDATHKLQTFSHDGRGFVLGELGQRYMIRIVNPTPARIEAVVSVDGLDAVDGKPASLDKRGYIVPAYGDVVIDGWRTSLDTVAAFRFSSVSDSYAGRTEHERNVGVIGAAFFRERAPRRVRSAPPMLSPRSAAPAPPSPSRGAADSAEASRAAAPEGAAGASKAEPAPAAARPGLGTEFGESETSSVVETSFVRADSRPAVITELRYDDRDGLLSRGIQIPPVPTNPENELRDTAEPFPVSRFAQPPL